MLAVALTGLILALFAAHATVLSAQISLPIPYFEYSTTVGCGNVFLHAVNSAASEILRIEADFARIPHARMHQTFDLAQLQPGVVVAVTVYSDRQLNRPNCTDVFFTDAEQAAVRQEVWQAIRGTLSVERGPRGVNANEPWLFRVRIRLEGAAFRGPSGHIIQMPEPFLWDGMVGWQAG